MMVTVHQPEHLPWLGFFDKMRQSDVFVLLDTVQFAKNDFQNRNRIKTRNGPVWLTVPVYKAGRSTQIIRDVEICNDRNWRNRSWRLIYESYKDAPHFAAHQPFFEDLYGRKWTNLTELNITIIRYMAEALGFGARLVTASELGNHESGATNVNLTISRHLGADTYLSGKFGREYLDEAPFAESGIAVAYQAFEHPEYPQLWADFEPYMSAIDLLFNCGPESARFIAEANAPAEPGAAEVVGA